MLKEDELVGAIAIYRQEVRPSPTSRSSWSQNFAAQAVIAIENTRLLNELRESLQQQTATADVLKVISARRSICRPCSKLCCESAARLCEADMAIMCALRRRRVSRRCHYGLPAEFVEYVERDPIEPGRGSGRPARVASTGKIVHIPDVAAIRNTLMANGSNRRRLPDALSAFRCFKEDEPIGVFVDLSRQEVQPIYR